MAFRTWAASPRGSLRSSGNAERWLLKLVLLSRTHPFVGSRHLLALGSRHLNLAHVEVAPCRLFLLAVAICDLRQFD